jgi:hypothetical protein
MYTATRLRSEKHRLEKARLEKAQTVMLVAIIMIVILGTALLVHALALAMIHFKVELFETLSADVGSLSMLSDARLGSALVGLLGFAIAIPAQWVFPAPWRSFFAVFIFAFHQMALLFLPNAFIGFLAIFAAAAILTLEVDRKTQVSLTKIDRN